MGAVLLTSYFICAPTLAQEEEQLAIFMIVHPEAQKDPDEFLRDHRVMMARGFFKEKENETLWFGMVNYPLYNFLPRDWMPYGEEVEILKTPELQGWNPDHLQKRVVGYNILLAEPKGQKGKSVVIGYTAPRKQNPNATWLVIRGGLYENLDLRYSRVLADALANLSSREAGTRSLGIQTLAFMGEEALPHLPEISKFLLDPDEMVVRSAVLAHFSLGGPDAEAALPTMIQALKLDKAPYLLASKICVYGPKAKAAVPDIIRLLNEARDNDASAHVQDCLKALSLIAPGAPQVVEAVGPYVNYRHSVDTRRYARIAAGLEIEE